MTAAVGRGGMTEAVSAPAVDVAAGAEAVRVVVPATSANLGPGFDALGLALTVHDEVVARATDGGLTVRVAGEGADEVRRDESHLVVRAMRATFDALGFGVPGLDVSCVNGLPHGRGLGSSAAAIVSGVLAAGALTHSGITSDLALRVACGLEGHPDNVAACLRGGLTISWYRDADPHAVRLEPAAGLSPVVFLPAERASTVRSRAALPDRVTHADAATAAGRSALLVHALTSRPDLLLDATEDTLHQPYRLPTMPASAELIARLRAAGVAAVLSGSGPSVLALAATPGQAEEVAAVAAPGFEVWPVDVDRAGARVLPLA